MADSNHDELLSQFTDITGTTAERATFFLESANWQLQVSLHVEHMRRAICIKTIFILTKYLVSIGQFL